jgi:hypothetical protein
MEEGNDLERARSENPKDVLDGFGHLVKDVSL